MPSGWLAVFRRGGGADGVGSVERMDIASTTGSAGNGVFAVTPANEVPGGERS